MFTGLIEEVGVVASARPLDDGREFRIEAATVMSDLGVGDSIAIDGACHTVVEVEARSFTVQSVATTLARTTFGEFESGRRVNLERAVALGTRIGGHLVQGHVDAVAEVVSIERVGEHVLIDFTLPAIVGQVTILHGSVTLNGISLTVNALPRSGIGQVSIIPHTWEVTNLSDLRQGDRVNLEGDMIGKYVRQLLSTESGGAGTNYPQHFPAQEG